MNRNRRKGFMALSLAAVMAVGSTAVALADEPGVVPGEAYTEAMARLQDSHMEYDELTDLIKNYYAPIKSAYATIDTMQEDQGSIATAMRVVADILFVWEDGRKYKIDKVLKIERCASRKAGGGDKPFRSPSQCSRVVHPVCPCHPLH